jgi:hypothetical protein
VTKESRRLEQAHEGAAWRKWGPYLSERQWGTVREDYSKDGNAWDYFSHDQARSRAYRWGEDGLAGISDDCQNLCFALSLWNGKDPILKERLFGLTNSEGNHGEDVKEYYFYLDSTPTHSYMKYLYKYPQGEFPYDNLVATNQKRTRHDSEYELLDVVSASHPGLGHRFLYCEGDVPLLFTENETNNEHLFGTPNQTLYAKDEIDKCVVHGESAAVNPQGKGTKVSPHYRMTVQPGQCAVIRLRLSDTVPSDLNSSSSAASSARISTRL